MATVLAERLLQKKAGFQETLETLVNSGDLTMQETNNRYLGS